MGTRITQESFASLAACWTTSKDSLRWQPIFVLPVWLKVWWEHFGNGFEPYLHSIWQDDRVIGIAPMLLKEKRASIMGSPDVCDYLDFVVAPGSEVAFFNSL